MNTFSLKIIAADKITAEEENVIHCAVRTPTGKMGFKPNHEPFITVLADNSTVEYKKEDNSEHSIAITTALFSFRNNTCVIAVPESAEN